MEPQAPKALQEHKEPQEVQEQLVPQALKAQPERRVLQEIRAQLVRWLLAQKTRLSDIMGQLGRPTHFL
jgi:hypothetical protein